VATNSFIFDVCLNLNCLVVAKIREFNGKRCILFDVGEGISAFYWEFDIFDLVVKMF
jgi:hypothetical protein